MGALQFFRIGEKVVYPTQGVGTVENISTRTFGSRFEIERLLGYLAEHTSKPKIDWKDRYKEDTIG